eukprot:CAMPEP_0180598134 /NCGR_PEP_ID=MMETSP1037_2-20121125/22706_1 /TAXON_ID=632150 /ORGANISM="Azadinium spinosum, Strain 3D9" /LENGTH=223 /DNA_ID=CAMNT_0022616729 /DNA_START=163 /DNA_END=836 /DNA_ORIENTATION=+
MRRTRKTTRPVLVNCNKPKGPGCALQNCPPMLHQFPTSNASGQCRTYIARLIAPSAARHASKREIQESRTAKRPGDEPCGTEEDDASEGLWERADDHATPMQRGGSPPKATAMFAQAPAFAPLGGCDDERDAYQAWSHAAELWHLWEFHIPQQLADQHSTQEWWQAPGRKKLLAPRASGRAEGQYVCSNTSARNDPPLLSWPPNNLLPEAGQAATENRVKKPT